jgi:FixJ family two-component response regulator
MRGMMTARLLIAVVDDEESIRRAFARMLTASLFDVDVFASGREFLDSLKERRPDCVILDLQMPGLTGRDVQRVLRLEQIRIPVIVVTAYDQPTLREQCLADGAVAYVSKPLRRESMIKLINEAVTQFAAAPRS